MNPSKLEIRRTEDDNKTFAFGFVVLDQVSDVGIAPEIHVDIILGLMHFGSGFIKGEER